MKAYDRPQSYRGPIWIFPNKNHPANLGYPHDYGNLCIMTIKSYHGPPCPVAPALSALTSPCSLCWWGSSWPPVATEVRGIDPVSKAWPKNDPPNRHIYPANKGSFPAWGCLVFSLQKGLCIHSKRRNNQLILRISFYILFIQLACISMAITIIPT